MCVRLAALKELIRAVVAHHPLLLRPIVDWLLLEPDFYKCPELLEYCFITMPYEYSKVRRLTPRDMECAYAMEYCIILSEFVCF